MCGLRVLIECAADLQRGHRERVAAAPERSVPARFSQAASARQIVERRSQDHGARPWKVGWQRRANRSRPGVLSPSSKTLQPVNKKGFCCTRSMKYSAMLRADKRPDLARHRSVVFHTHRNVKIQTSHRLDSSNVGSWSRRCPASLARVL